VHTCRQHLHLGAGSPIAIRGRGNGALPATSFGEPERESFSISVSSSSAEVRGGRAIGLLSESPLCASHPAPSADWTALRSRLRPTSTLHPCYAPAIHQHRIPVHPRRDEEGASRPSGQQMGSAEWDSLRSRCSVRREASLSSRHDMHKGFSSGSPMSGAARHHFPPRIAIARGGAKWRCWTATCRTHLSKGSAH